MNLNSSVSRFILIFSMFVMGACGLMYEYVLSILGNHLMGTSHEQIFIIIGLMLFAMGIGTLIQRSVRTDLLDAFLLLEIILGLAGGFGAIAIYSAFAYWESFEIILYGFAFCIGAAIGMEIPLLIRINDEYAESLRTNLSEILSVDYIGSLVGAFLFTYVLLTQFSLAKIGFILGLANAGIAVVSLFYFRTLVRYRRTLILVAGIAIPALIAGFIFADDWTLKAEQRYYRDPIIFRKTTKFQHIIVTRNDKRVDMYLNGNLQFSSLDEYIYHDYLVHPAMSAARQRDRILILGGGDGLALREVLKYREAKEIILVDIDPEVIRVSSTQPDLVRLNGGAFGDARVRAGGSPGIISGEKVTVHQISQRRTELYEEKKYPMARVNLYNIDADKFIRSVKGRFDVVILDFPDPSMIELSKLYSLDFYRALKKKLAPGAVAVQQSTSPFFARDAFLCIGRTLRAAGFKVLPFHAAVPSFGGDWGWYFIWADRRSPKDIIKQLSTGTDFAVPTRYLRPQLLGASFLFGKNILRTTRTLRINTKMRPVLQEYYRNSWEGYE